MSGVFMHQLHDRVPNTMAASSASEVNQQPDVYCDFGDPAVGTYLPKDRVASIFDAIVAIAATILVLGIKVSGDGTILTFRDFARASHEILNWFVSFMMVFVIWAQYHFIFAHSTRSDTVLLILAFLQVAAVSLIPFTSGVVGDHPESSAATIVFAGVMAANGLLLTLNAWFLRQKRHLHVSDHSYDGLGRRIRTQVVVYSVVVVVAVTGAAVHHPLWGVVAWILCPIAMAVLLRPSARS